MTKHRMFSGKVYPSPDTFTQPLVEMVVTFYMSALQGEEKKLSGVTPLMTDLPPAYSDTSE